MASPTVGACYPGCNPLTPGDCGSGYQCLALDLDGNGYCVAESASGAEGDTCSTTYAETGCGSGLQCVVDGVDTVCRQTCDFFDGGGCPSGQFCGVFGSCISDTSFADSAMLGQSCSGVAEAGTICNVDGAAGLVNGACFDVLGTGTLTCIPQCELGGDDCQDPFFSECEAPAGYANVGVCVLPD